MLRISKGVARDFSHGKDYVRIGRIVAKVHVSGSESPVSLSFPSKSDA